MSNPLSTRVHAPSLALLMTTVLIAASGCSDVRLSYQMPAASVLSQTTTREATLSQGVAETALARLTLKTSLQIPPAELTGMRLRLLLTHDNTVLQQLEFPAERFLSDPDLLWLELPLGNARLEVAILDPSGAVISLLQNRFVLTADAQQQVDFGLTREAGALEAQMTLAYRSDLSDVPFSFEQLRFALPLPTDAGKTPSNPPASVVNPVMGSSDPSVNTLANDLKLRLVESGQTRLLFFWEAPAQIEVDTYRLLLEGKIIVEQHPLSNYRVENLLNNTLYAFTVQAVGKDGQILSEQSLSAKTGVGASGGGGGGGGGGGSSPPPVNNPPRIESLTATRTILPAPGYPVGLQASAADEGILPNAAYTWSCEACGDASFNTPTGTASTGIGSDLIWNAPSTPGSYTLMLSVSDGVNAPVTRTQIIVVNQRLGTVIVEGAYQ